MGSGNEHAKLCSSYDYGARSASIPLVDEKSYILSQLVNLPFEAKTDSTIDIDFYGWNKSHISIGF